MQRFEVVAVNDVDELLVVDPLRGKGLIESLLEAKDKGVLKPFAVDIFQRLDFEPDAMQWDKPILKQRTTGRYNTTYCKSCVFSVPLQWHRGGHFSDFPQCHMPRNLFLFHLRYCDLTYLIERQGQRQTFMSSANMAETNSVAGQAWTRGEAELVQLFDKVASSGPILENDFSFGIVRRAIKNSWQLRKNSALWGHVELNPIKTYHIPAQFHDLF